MGNESKDKPGNSIEQDGDDDQLSGSRNPDKSKSSAKKTSLSYNKPIIAGYLFKRGRQGKWQRRWFESDGKDLLYFKSNKRKKLLATLDLMHVGSISMDNTDPSSCSFIIEVAGRDFNLCADSKDHAMDWVISLNRVREARMGFGNLQLIEPSQNEDKDLDDDCSPRVVVDALRERAKVLGMEDFIDEAEDVENNGDASGKTGALSAVDEAEYISCSNAAPNIPSNKKKGILTRWRKGRPSYQNWMRRLSRWVKRLTMVRCVVVDKVDHLGNTVEGRKKMRSAHRSPLFEIDEAKPQAKDKGSDQVLSQDNNLECLVESSAHRSPLFEIDEAKPQAKDEGSDQVLSQDNNLECLVESTETDNGVNLDPELHVAEQPVNQNPQNDLVEKEIPKLLPDQLEKTKATTTTWGMASQKRALREKMEDLSSRENSSIGDMDSSSTRDSTSNVGKEGSEVV